MSVSMRRQVVDGVALAAPATVFIEAGACAPIRRLTPLPCARACELGPERLRVAYHPARSPAGGLAPGTCPRLASARQAPSGLPGGDGLDEQPPPPVPDRWRPVRDALRRLA